MKVFVLLCSIVLMSPSTCEVEEPFDAANGKRSFVSGTILDNNGSPIPNYDVEVRSAFDVVGRASTNDQGDFEMAIIEDIDGIYDLRISQLEQDGTYTYFHVSYRYNEPQSSRSYVLPEVNLRRKSQVNLVINNASGEPYSGNTSFSRPFCSYNFSEDVLISSGCFEAANQGFSGNVNQTIQTPLNSLLTITITRNGTSTEYNYQIDSVNYEISLTI